MSICANSVLLVLYSADVRAEESLNSLPSAIRGRKLQFVSHNYDNEFYMELDFIRLPIIILLAMLLASCASFKKSADTGNRIIITDSTLRLIEGRYKRESVQLQKDSSSAADLYWNLYANSYSFIFKNDKGLNHKSDTNFIELKVVNKNEILALYTSGSEVLTAKVLKGKVKNGYFIFRRKYLFLPFVFANIYRNTKFRIGLLDEGNLIADYKEIGFATIYVIFPDFRNISENDIIFERIKEISP